MNILVIDIGGSNIKVLATGMTGRLKVPSGPKLTPEKMVKKVKKLIADFDYDVISIGYPGQVLNQRVAAEPRNLGPGWRGFDFELAFGCPVRLINDAAMQALGGYQGGAMLFLGLGTGFGAAMVVNGVVEPAELGHLSYKKHNYEYYVGARALARNGKKKWAKNVRAVINRFQFALQPDEILIGGGNVKKLDELPPGCRRGNNADAFVGGFRLWNGVGPQ